MPKTLRYKTTRWSLVSRALRRAIIRRLIFPSSKPATSLCPAFCSRNDAIGIEVLCSGTFEKEFLTLSETILTDHLSSQNIDSVTKVAIDIGANIGTHALYFSGLADRVLAFEPNPPLALICRANALAAARANIEIFEIALSDHNGTESLFVSNDMDYGEASLDRAYSGTSTISVAVKRADDFIQPLIKPDERIVLIKIDVEGHEAKTLKGILNIIRRHKPVVIFESASRAHLLSCIEILESVGYIRFDAVHKNWDENGGFSKLLAIVLGKTEISVLPINRSKNKFYSAVVARPPEIK